MSKLSKDPGFRFELAKNLFFRCNSVNKIISEKDLPAISDFLKKSGLNHILKDKKLNFDWARPYSFVADGNRKVKNILLKSRREAGRKENCRLKTLFSVLRHLEQREFLTSKKIKSAPPPACAPEGTASTKQESLSSPSAKIFSEINSNGFFKEKERALSFKTKLPPFKAACSEISEQRTCFFIH